MELYLRITMQKWNARYDDEVAPQTAEGVNFLAVEQLWKSGISPT